MMFRPAILSFLLAASRTTASMIVSESRTRLPMSLSTVISDLEAEGMAELSTACLIASRSVTLKERQACLESLLGADGDSLSASSKAVATAKGLALANCGTNLEEVVLSTVACQGSVIFIPSVSDLSRGEGLLDYLAPAMERLIQWQSSQESSTAAHSKACLVVVCDPQVGTATTKAQLEAAAQPILETLAGSQTQQLQDVFGSVLYLTAPEVEAALLNHQQLPDQSTTPEEAMASVASVVSEDGPPLSLSKSKIQTQPNELAAARQLEPAKRQAQEEALTLVQEATSQDTQLVAEFGSLCDAALQQTLENFKARGAHLTNTQVGKDLAACLQQELASQYYDHYELQLSLLEDACFATMKQSMSQLRLGATLATQMEVIVKDTISSFATQAQKLIPSKAGSSSTWKARAAHAKTALTKRLADFTQDRLLAAEASGQFKPVPRKGVTIGMHWLLPKPFGNDYRQEPWMVHATDNLVYVPRRGSKVTEVPPESVVSEGDWRDRVVPSPAGRDMVFMQ